MEIIQSIINTVKNHWVDILALIGAVDLALGIITRLTPSQWDDNLYSVVHGWVSKLLKKQA